MVFRFSVVMAAYNSGEYIREAIDSLVNQSLDFKENIQLIVVNDGSSDNTESIVREYIEAFPDNVLLVSNNINCGPAHARNIGLSLAEGEIINFLDSDDYISKKTFERVDIFLDDYQYVDMVAIPIKFAGAKRGDHPLNYKFKSSGIVNLLEIPEFIQLSSASAFFRREVIKNREFNRIKSPYIPSISEIHNESALETDMEPYIKGKSLNYYIPVVFNENLSVSEDALLINQILLRNPLLGLLNNCTYYYRKKESENTSLISDSANHKSYFTTRIDEYMIRIINDSLDLYGQVPEFIQHIVMYDLQWIMEIRQINHLLSIDEIMVLYDKIISILFYIGDKAIFKQRSIPSILKAHIILIKYFKWNYLDRKTFGFNQIEDSYYDSLNNNLIPYMGKNELSFIINYLELNKVYLDIVEFKNPNELYVSGHITSFFHNDFEIYAVLSEKDKNSQYTNEEIYKVKRVNYPQRDNLSLNFNYGYNHDFEVRIPIYRNDLIVSFRTSFRNLNEVCRDLKMDVPNEGSPDYFNHHDLSFSGDLLIDYNHTSGLSRISSYKISKDYILIDNGSNIAIRKRSIFKILKFEFFTLVSILADRKEGWRTGFVLRILYFIYYPFYRNKRIWIFSDLPYAADDNGLQLFKAVNEFDKLSLEEFNRTLDLEESILSKSRKPYKAELFEGKEIRLIDLIKDLFRSIRNIRNREEEADTRVRFIENGSLDFNPDSDFNESDLLDFDNAFRENHNSFLKGQGSALNDYSDSNLSADSNSNLMVDSDSNLSVNLNSVDSDSNLSLGRDSVDSDSNLSLSRDSDDSVSDAFTELNSDDNSELVQSSSSDYIRIRSKRISKPQFVKSIDGKLDAKYNEILANLDSRLDDRVDDVKVKIKSTDVKSRIKGPNLRRKDEETDYYQKRDLLWTVMNYDYMAFLRENKFTYLINYILYRISKKFFVRRDTAEIDNRKIRKYFTLEQSTSHFNNIRHLENQYIASSTKSKIRKLLAREKESGEYKYIKGIGNVIAYKSLKHRILSLYAEVIVSSHPDNNLIYPFYGNFPHLAGFVKSKTVFLQHGVTKDNVSYWLNRFDKNLSFILTVSDKERESFLEPYYGYDEDIIKVLGFPRFDYLEALDDRHEIVIMPTWRRHLHNNGPEEFHSTRFFNVFNSLINDKELLDCLDKAGYRLVFKPHPNLNKYINLFDRDSRVEFDLSDLNSDSDKFTSRRYADIFNHSSLLVTDFSSVSFDFAYIKKPVIYYQYENDYHFDSENGYFDYESMGFGPVIDNHEELIKEIKDYVDSSCKMDEKYKKRVDEFFKFTDRNNSKRVYKAILEMDKYY
ncbi:CDP-glycerol glycerophosphotransferase family protein [uncultured Methanobrevibacter sp.]|uniref:bifunctional glycosyltransferase/CDP-glycerol:glycerophosphate glycerophosphotransferase n=1 Tax=uncultured Methanobrevibacter sp. TaxID=253161 RepID=UPI0026253E72